MYDSLMEKHKQNESSFDIWQHLPESKLELIGGRLIAGNSRAGSRYLLWSILTLLGPHAALAVAPTDLWWKALGSTFRAPASLATPRAWEAWAAQIPHSPRLEPVGQSWSRKHHDAWSLLMCELHQALREDGHNIVGRSIQRFALQLGDDVLMPDLQCFRRDRQHRLHTYYFDGPADLVIEVMLPGAEQADRDTKRQLYAAGNVPEYWIVDPQARRLQFLRLADGGYEEHLPDADGRYRSTGMSGLVCDVAGLMACLDNQDKHHNLQTRIFTVEPATTAAGSATRSVDREDWSWEWREFVPPVGLQREAISFEQFIDWCPEAKFELSDGKPLIGCWDGTRKVLGMLLCTFGLEEAVTLLDPREWVAALLAEQGDRYNEEPRRDAWWNTARQAAEMLRERFGAERIAVIGDMLRPEPLHFWSEITFVVWGLQLNQPELYQMLDELPGGRHIQLRDAASASSRQQAALESESILLWAAKTVRSTS